MGPALAWRNVPHQNTIYNRYIVYVKPTPTQTTTTQCQAARHNPILPQRTSSLQNYMATCPSVSTLINKSGSSVWHVETNDKNERTVNRLKTLTPKVKIVSESGKSLDKDDSLVLGPKLDLSGMKKVYKQAESSTFSSDTDKERADKLNSFCCRAVRDILQRILPLYSKVKLKRDSSNVLYVSFLACDCFKKSFEEFVTLFSFQPVHFLDVPPKKSLQLLHANLSQRRRDIIFKSTTGMPLKS